MFKKISILLLLGVTCAQAQNQPSYDSYGQLITDYEQTQRDREEGILQRGGYDPQAAAVGAAQRQARTGNAPMIGNSNAPNPNSLSDRSIYRCKHNGRDVYVDEDGKRKFSQCQLIRQGKTEVLSQQQAPAQADPSLLNAQTHFVPPTNSVATTAQTPPEATFTNPESTAPVVATQGSGNIPCSGAILYKGSTYIFTEYEPCPIPEDIFKQRRPIEAEPNYYAQ